MNASHKPMTHPVAQPAIYGRIPVHSHGYLAATHFSQTSGISIYIAANDRQMEEAAALAQSVNPALTILHLPAWDCLPYDRVSPAHAITAERIAALSYLATNPAAAQPLLIVTTLNAAMQTLPPKSLLAASSFIIRSGSSINRDALLHFLTDHGYQRTSKAMEPGEFAVRGNIIDLFPPGTEEAIRLDLFGDEVETIRTFDPLTQISLGSTAEVTLRPVSEVLLSAASIERFRIQYRELFGAVSKDNPLYEAVSEGRHFIGVEHWLPLFYEQTDSLFDYAPNATILMDGDVPRIYQDRLEQIQDYYEARVAHRANPSDMPYHPLPPEQLYLLEDNWQAQLNRCTIVQLSLIDQPDAQYLPIAPTPSFAAEANAHGDARFASLRERLMQRDKPMVITGYSAGSTSRIQQMLIDAGLPASPADTLAAATSLAHGTIGVTCLPIEHGFETPQLLLISEQDLLGERIIRTQRRKRHAEAFMAEASSLNAGELIVHKEHGIGRFEGLVTVEVNDNKHDCLKLVYAGDDKLFLPVVNMEMVSRFGSEAEGIALDKLGGLAWQKRKAAMKQRIKLAAEQLLKIAAKRATREAPELVADSALYAEFCARFAYSETDDQQRAIDDVLSDLAAGRPMDRLICGDVGFGKTEVALRAAFAVAASPEKMQVAIIAPTTLLARQHLLNFSQRFQGFDLTIRGLSRLIPAKQQKETIEQLGQGKVDIVVGTHALLSKQVQFHNLGLVIVDEEQHFGVAQKERLKQLRANIHVLTLSATPIPRTLQMALSGVRELSLITTPPVDRLAVRSFVMPYDGLVIKEAILREFHRGGKVFYVTPRIEYLDDLRLRLGELVPDLKVATAHGQLPAAKLDQIMQDFYDGKYDILLSTSIIESGLDVPTANTMIIDHANLFGLAQLYQLRGRVGRGKLRAYAYFTLPGKKKLTPLAVKRLEVMSTLDTLGAGFSLASHDMDIRGFGNLLGEEQSGHVREVGVELYQHMLEETIRQMKEGRFDQDEQSAPDDWSPQINLGSSVLIPESYVEALDLRMNLYRRLANLQEQAEIDAFAAELIDRFGPLPEEVKQLLHVLHVKHLCKVAGIERLDTGPKGAVFTFKNNRFAKPESLLVFIAGQKGAFKIRPDQKLVYHGNWRNAAERFAQIDQAVLAIAGLVE